MRAAISPIDVSISTAKSEVCSALAASSSTFWFTVRVDSPTRRTDSVAAPIAADWLDAGLAELRAALLERARDGDDLGNALPHLRHERAQARGHRVERARELAELAARGFGDLHGEIAVGDRGRCLHCGLERSRDVAAEPVGEREREQERPDHRDAERGALRGQAAHEIRGVAADPELSGVLAVELDRADQPPGGARRSGPRARARDRQLPLRPAPNVANTWPFAS
jgi:hypothetical protein